MGKIYEFEGLMAPVFTPFSKEDFSLNLEIIPTYAKLLAETGINGVLVNGTSGEGMSMNVEERQRVAEAWKEVSLRTHQNVMVQVGGAPLPDVLRLAAHADKCGVDSLLCLPDLFHKPSSVKELLEYLKLVSNSAPNTPILYYHLPAFTGVNVSITDLFSEAWKSNLIPMFAGAKFTHTNLEDGASSINVGSQETGGGVYSVFLGSDEDGQFAAVDGSHMLEKKWWTSYDGLPLLFDHFFTSIYGMPSLTFQIMLGAFALGFNSAIGTTFNMLPNFGKSILSAAKQNQFEEGRRSQWKLTRAVRVITKHGRWVPTMKAAMNLLTPIDVGPPRPPLKCLSAAQEMEMKEDLSQLINI